MRSPARVASRTLWPSSFGSSSAAPCSAALACGSSSSSGADSCGVTRARALRRRDAIRFLTACSLPPAATVIAQGEQTWPPLVTERNTLPGAASGGLVTLPQLLRPAYYVHFI